MEQQFTVGQPVIVYRGAAPRGGHMPRYEAVIAKVGRTLVTIEWANSLDHMESVQFRMSDQHENLPPSRTYAGSGVFRTLEQDAEAQRKHAAEDGFTRLGLHKNRADSLTLDEMEAVIKLLEKMRQTP